MRYWWVNQNQTFRQEQDGGYLWSPKRKANGHLNHFYETMREVAPGDLVLSFQGQYIRSIGIVRSYCYESPKPPEFGAAGPNWSQIGWRVDIRWVQLDNQIRPASHIAAIRPALPPRYSPVRAENGHGLQSVYLASVPDPLMQILATLIGYQALDLMTAPRLPQPDLVAERPDEVEHLYTEWEEIQERQLLADTSVAETDRSALILSRRGQGVFRRRVQRVESACRVTRVDNPEHLIASHCKPWRHASNDERLDGENGLLLTPTVDHLFDRGFISFEDSGRLLVSPVADGRSLERMGVPPRGRVSVGTFSEGQRRYLDYHRDAIFLETARR